MACSCKTVSSALPKGYQDALGSGRRVVAMFAVDKLLSSWEYHTGLGAKRKDGWYRAAMRTDQEKFRVHGRIFAKRTGHFSGAFFPFLTTSNHAQISPCSEVCLVLPLLGWLLGLLKLRAA